MKIQHKNLADGNWRKLSLIEQMANIGSEVERSLKWKEKNNTDYFMKAFERVLELLDLSLDDPKNRTRLRELTRVREALVDYFYGPNQFSSTASLWRNYFYRFNYASRRNC